MIAYGGQHDSTARTYLLQANVPQIIAADSPMQYYGVSLNTDCLIINTRGDYFVSCFAVVSSTDGSVTLGPGTDASFSVVYLRDVGPPN